MSNASWSRRRRVMKTTGSDRGNVSKNDALNAETGYSPPRSVIITVSPELADLRVARTSAAEPAAACSKAAKVWWAVGKSH